MIADYKNIIPNKVLFNLREVENIGILKIDMAKKLIVNGEIEAVRIGNKLHISRDVLIKYLEDNTMAKVA